LLGPVVRKHRDGIEARELRPSDGYVVGATLDQREPKIDPGRPTKKGQVLADQLLLQVDRIRRYDGDLSVEHGPANSREKIRDRLPDSGPGLREPDPWTVIEV